MSVEDAFAGANRDVVAVLVDNHRQFLAFLERRVGDRALAEDILQDAFVRSVDRAETLRSEESAVAWFYRMLRNAVIDHHRRRGARDRALSALVSELEQDTGPGPDTADTVCKCVARLAETLKPEYAEALRLIEVEGLSLQEVATRLGISPGNAGVRVHRAREALRKRVTASCGTCAAHGCLDCTCGTAGGGCKPADET